MAEKGAHLSATFVKKPSIFELIAQDALSNTFYPAFKHIADFLVSRNPVKYYYLNKWFEELYLGFNLLLQYHYLKNYDATFSEKFYSLRRISINSVMQNAESRLSAKQKMLSLLFSVVFPYIRNKLQIIVENIEHGEEYKNQFTIPKDYKQKLVSLYKSFHVFIESLRMFYYLRYMIGRSDTHSVSLLLARVTLAYFDDKTQNTICWKMILKEIFSGNWRSSVHLFSLMQNSFGRALELSAFFIQFLNWWHSEKLHTKFFAFPTPSAPQIKINQAQKSNLKNICPICRGSFRIPTALPVSGYVFCFSCIRKYISLTGKCPVTNLPAAECDLIRIYSESST